MLVRLTHRGKPTIFNAKEVVTLYMDTDLKSGEYKCKITTTNGCVFVDEPLNVVHEKLNMAVMGEFTTDYDYDVPTIDERVSKNNYHQTNSYGRPHPQQYRNGRHRNNSYYEYDREQYHM